MMTLASIESLIGSVWGAVAAFAIGYIGGASRPAVEDRGMDSRQKGLTDKGTVRCAASASRRGGSI